MDSEERRGKRGKNHKNSKLLIKKDGNEEGRRYIKGDEGRGGKGAWNRN